MALKRTAGYTIFAIFTFILGAAMAVGAFIMSRDIEVEIAHEDRTKDFAAFLDQMNPSHKTYRHGLMAVSAVISLGLIVSGIGLYRMAGWGMKMAVLFWLLAAVTIIVFLLYFVNFIDPAMQQFMDKPGRRSAFQAIDFALPLIDKTAPL